MMTPLHVGTINGAPVRFFRTPIKDGRPDLPWTAWDDLTAAFPLTADHQMILRQRLRTDWGGVSHTIASTTGLVVIVPHIIAKGFVDGMAEFEDTGASDDYAKSLALAMKAMMAHLPLQARLDYAVTGLHRWDDEEGLR